MYSSSRTLDLQRYESLAVFCPSASCSSCFCCAVFFLLCLLRPSYLLTLTRCMFGMRGLLRPCYVRVELFRIVCQCTTENHLYNLLAHYIESLSHTNPPSCCWFCADGDDHLPAYHVACSTARSTPGDAIPLCRESESRPLRRQATAHPGESAGRTTTECRQIVIRRSLLLYCEVGNVCIVCVASGRGVADGLILLVSDPSE